MNNDLEQFSEERLKDMQKHVTAGMTLGHADAMLIRQAIGIALAAKQAKPEYFIVSRLFTDGYGTHVELDVYIEHLDASKCKDDHGGVIIPCYTTPQPVHIEQDGWIKCSERMPKDSLWCAVNTEYGYYVQCWGSEQGWLGDEISIPNCDVTHWMPLPAAPKPESE